MKNFSQIFLLIFLSSLAIGLGVLAYRLASDTLWFAFEWEQNQRWQELVVAVDLPWTLSRIIPPWTLLDEEVIRSSILKNGIPLDPEQENFEIFFTESFVKITPKNAQEGDIFTLSAELYNAQKKTAYRLPSDISVTISQDSQTGGDGFSKRWEIFGAISKRILSKLFLWKYTLACILSSKRGGLFWSG